jgi:hypothetical protein
MKALLRATLLVLIAFAIFSAFSGSANEAFGQVGPRPAPQAPCMPPAQGHAVACVQ